MVFETCPFCAEAVHVFHFPGGWLLIACGSCDAQWESHSGVVRRINDGELLGIAEGQAGAGSATRLMWAEVECPTCGEGTQRRSVVEFRGDLWVMCGTHGMQEVDPTSDAVNTTWPGALIPRSKPDS
jgi:hypothetical protein